MGFSMQPTGKGGKKPLDVELNLVPFIDLLITNICFLLITAVWTQLARMNVSQKSSGQPQEQTEPPPEQVNVTVLVEDDGYTLIAGGDRLSISKVGDHYDVDKLATQLREVKTRLPDKTDIKVAAEDGIRYDYIIQAMDVCLTERFPDIQLVDAAAAM
jgi:biopolymer transport protein ExbD